MTGLKISIMSYKDGFSAARPGLAFLLVVRWIEPKQAALGCGDCCAIWRFSLQRFEQIALINLYLFFETGAFFKQVSELLVRRAWAVNWKSGSRLTELLPPLMHFIAHMRARGHMRYETLLADERNMLRTPVHHHGA